MEVPLTHTAQDDTTAADYSGVPTSVTFESDETSQTFTFTAAADDADDDSDSVLLGFGALPDDVSAGATATSTVSITDDDVPCVVQVSYGASSYSVAEGGTVTVTVELSAAPEREVEVPITHTAQGDTTAADYSGVPTSVTFAVGRHGEDLHVRRGGRRRGRRWRLGAAGLRGRRCPQTSPPGRPTRPPCRSPTMTTRR